jgi:hypothetical protein
VHAVLASHKPFVSHVCALLLLHWVALGVQLPVHPPSTQAWFMQVVTFDSLTRSGPHWMTFWPMQTFWSGRAPVQSATMVAQFALCPGRVSQFWSGPQNAVDIAQSPSEPQDKCCGCAYPLQPRGVLLWSHLHPTAPAAPSSVAQSTELLGPASPSVTAPLLLPLLDPLEASGPPELELPDSLPTGSAVKSVIPSTALHAARVPSSPIVTVPTTAA